MVGKEMSSFSTRTQTLQEKGEDNIWCYKIECFCKQRPAPGGTYAFKNSQIEYVQGQFQQNHNHILVYITL